MATKPRSPRPKAKRLRKLSSSVGFWTAIALIVLLAAYLATLAFLRPQVSGDELRSDQLEDLAERGRIQEARLLDEDAYIVGSYTRDDGSVGRYKSALVKTEKGDVVDFLSRNRIPTTIDPQSEKSTAKLLTTFLPAVMVIPVFFYLVLSYRKGTGLFSSGSGAHKFDSKDNVLTFADIAGQDEAVAELRDIKEFLTDPSRLMALGATVPKGVLLVGPPGCGKTLLARCLAGETGANFYSISGSDFVELYQGVGAARVRGLFKQARENAPAIIFIDEIDAVGRTRVGSALSTPDQEQQQALNQILTEMDGFSPSQGIVLIGATNRPDTLDQALLRPGRFDRTVALERPDEDARLAILRLHARGKTLGPDVDLASIAQRAIGLTGADLANVVNEGAVLAARAMKPAVTQMELDLALQRTLDAPERQRRLSLHERSIGRRYTREERVTFADVAGADDAITELAEVRDFLADPDRFAAIGARVPRGILMAGPPGCGKTLLARAVAGEANAAFLAVSGSEFVEALEGQGAARVRQLFGEAKTMAPVIVFIDEIDALGGRRGALSGEREQTLNQLLVELDGFDPSEGLIVMAATNRPDILDPALTRAGRFDRQVSVTLPDRAGRRQILAIHARGKRLGPDVDLSVIADLTQGFSGADLANVLNEAALLASRRGLTEIPMAAVEEGIDRALMGVESRATIMTDEERQVVAYHEVGHALVGRALPGAPAPRKVTLVGRGSAMGRCTVADSDQRIVRSRSMLSDRMAGLLAGRAAEELGFGDPVSDSAYDLQQATELARQMVSELGMSEAVGRLAFGNGPGDGRRGMQSEEAARTVDAEIRRMVDEAYGRAMEVLEASGDQLERVVEALLDQETLTADQLDDIAGPPPAVRPPKAPARARKKAAQPAAPTRKAAKEGAARKAAKATKATGGTKKAARAASAPKKAAKAATTKARSR